MDENQYYNYFQDKMKGLADLSDKSVAQQEPFFNIFWLQHLVFLVSWSHCM